MRTRSLSNFPVVSSSNPSTSTSKRRNRRRSKQPFIIEESPVDTMTDQRTMTELLRAPTEGYAEAIVVPPILAEQFELKHSERISKKDKIGSKPDKNGKRGEAGKSQKQLQWIKKEKLKKMQKEGPEMQSHSKL
nr:reverse transcriptase domain-containing protein [Tanacetum cinerariifolium]